MFQLTGHGDTVYIHPLLYECYTGPKRGAASQTGITAPRHGEEGGQVKTPPAARCGGHLSVGKEDLTPRSCESLVRTSEACYCEEWDLLIQLCGALTWQPMTISCFTKMHGSGVTPEEGGDIQYVRCMYT